MEVLDEVRLTRAVIAIHPNTCLALFLVEDRIQQLEKMLNQFVGEDVFANFSIDDVLLPVAYDDSCIDMTFDVPGIDTVEVSCGCGIDKFDGTVEVLVLQRTKKVIVLVVGTRVE